MYESAGYTTECSVEILDLNVLVLPKKIRQSYLGKNCKREIVVCRMSHYIYIYIYIYNIYIYI